MPLRSDASSHAQSHLLSAHKPEFRIPDLVRTPVDLTHFYVITPITNQWEFKARYELYWKFARMINEAGGKLITVEQAFGERPFMVTQEANMMHVQVRSHDEVWLKENLINLGITRAMQLDPKCNKVAWIDADCFPMIPAREWLEKIVHGLDHFEFLQCWGDLLNFGPENQLIGIPQPSFMKTWNEFGFRAPSSSWLGTVKRAPHFDYTPDYTDDAGVLKRESLGRPGLAWAANIDALNKVGGLIDFCILGSGDWHMAHALVGAMTEQTTLVGTMQGHGSQEYAMPDYTHALLEWQSKCERRIQRDVGHLPVSVGHWWHGPYVSRKYGSRGVIMIRNKFNPYRDIKKDVWGVIQLETWTPESIMLRDECRDYFRSRNEDSLTM